MNLRKVSLTAEEARVSYIALSQGKNQRGHSRKDLKRIDPILDDLEAVADEDQKEFQDVELVLKESDWTFACDVIDNSGGWMGQKKTRKIVMSMDEKWHEAVREKEKEEKKKEE